MGLFFIVSWTINHIFSSNGWPFSYNCNSFIHLNKEAFHIFITAHYFLLLFNPAYKILLRLNIKKNIIKSFREYFYRFLIFFFFCTLIKVSALLNSKERNNKFIIFSIVIFCTRLFSVENIGKLIIHLCNQQDIFN